MRDLRTNEMDQVSGGTFGLLSKLFCKPVYTYCPPSPPKKDDCKPAKPDYDCKPKKKWGC